MKQILCDLSSKYFKNTVNKKSDIKKTYIYTYWHNVFHSLCQLFRPLIIYTVLIFTDSALIASQIDLVTTVQSTPLHQEILADNTSNISIPTLTLKEIKHRIKQVKEYTKIVNLQTELNKIPQSSSKDKLQRQLVVRGIYIFNAKSRNLLKDIKVHGITTSKIDEIDKLSAQINSFCNLYEKIIPIKDSVALNIKISILKSKKIQALYEQELKSDKLFYTAEKIKTMFDNGALSENIYSEIIWDEPILDERKNPIRYFDKNIDETSAQICALLIQAINKNRLYWNGPSGIQEVSRKEIIGSFAKYIKEKGTADFYINLIKIQPEIFENIMDSILNQKRTQSIKGALYFKESSWLINMGISSYNMDFIKSIFAQNGKYRWDYINYFQMVPAIFYEINELTNLIENSSLKHRMTLYRGEQMDGLLNFLKDRDGHIIKAGTKIENFIINNPQATDTEIEKFASSLLKGKLIKQDRFLSTTISKNLAIEWAISNRINGGDPKPYKIIWKINTDAGAKGVFLEIFNRMANNHFDQYEFLFQRSGILKYISCNFDKKTGILEIEADFIQSEQPDKPKIIYYSNQVKDLFCNYLKNKEKFDRGEISSEQFTEEEMKINIQMLEEIKKGTYRESFTFEEN